MIANPLGADTLWLLSGDDGFGVSRPKKLYRSTNGGATWSEKSGTYNAIDFSFHANGRPLLLTTSINGPGGDDDSGLVVRSMDGSGDSWTAGTIANGSPATGAVWWDGATAYFINVQRNACGGPPFPPGSGKFVSPDSGVTWTKADSGGTWEVGWTNCAGARGRALNTVAKTLSGKGEYWVSPQFVWRYASNKYENAFSYETSSGAWLTKGIDNANPSAFASASRDTLFAGYYDLGIWRSTNGGSGWKNINPSAMPGWNGFGGNVTGISVNGDVLCATMAASSKDSSGAFRYSVWRSTDRGLSWSLYRQNGITYPGFMYGLSRDPVTGDMWLTEDGRLYKSTNGGVDWSHVTSDSLPTHGLYVTQAKNGVVLAGGTHGLYRWAPPSGPWASVHSAFNFAGASFTDPDTGIAGSDLQQVRWHGIQQIYFDPFVANRVWVVAYFKNGATTTKRKGVWKSDDNGLTFSAVIDTVLCRGAAVDSSGYRLHVTSGLAFSAGTSIASELAAAVGKQTCHATTNGTFSVNNCNDETNHALYRYPFGSVIHIPDGTCSIYVGVPGYGFMRQYLLCGSGGGGCSSQPDCEMDGPGGGGGNAAREVTLEGAADLTLDLRPPQPSPSRGLSTLSWSIPQREASKSFELSLFDIAGRRVAVLAAGIAKAGKHSAELSFTDDSGARLRNGVFFVRLKVDEQTLRRTVILVR